MRQQQQLPRLGACLTALRLSTPTAPARSEVSQDQGSRLCGTFKGAPGAQGKIATAMAAVSEHYNQTTVSISNPRCMQIEGT